MSLGLRVQLHGDTAQDLRRLPAVLRKASRRAVGQTARETREAMVRAIGATYGIPLRALRSRRVQAYLRLAGVRARVWTGHAPIKAAYVGRLRQEEWGSSAGAYLFPGSFVARMPSGHRGVFHRAGHASLPIIEDVVALPKVPALAEALATRATLRLAALIREMTQDALPR
ncbi:phage tail protein [Methylococcus mesophilus]|uniref:phage tail protein n=1 Tax=Methylococcus mesophilus TaxID=2993564 RepID=UPI00224B7CAB|nr:phage tail protein [Methylococcus mesophilus]UZR30789.1 phage tail protein [Methylococcus mesophilus]